MTHYTGVVRHVRRRHHGDAIVAQIELLNGFWQGTLWFTSDASGTTRTTAKLPFRASAEWAADLLAHTGFGHSCAAGACADWVSWPLRSEF